MKTELKKKYLGYLADCLMVIAAVVVFLALARGLWSFLDDAFPTKDGTIGDRIKAWAILFPIMPFSGFVTNCFWEYLNDFRTGKGRES